MQNYIIRYVEDLKASIEPTGCSIATALSVELPKMDRLRIFKLLAAADDLRRILELELQRREPPCEQATYYGCVWCQSFHFEGDPLYAQHLLGQSKHGLQRGLRPRPEPVDEAVQS